MRPSTTTRPIRRALVALAAPFLLTLSACGEDGAPTAGTADRGGATVRIERSRFLPEELTVAAGTTVTFVNADPVDHTVTAREEVPGALDSGTLAGEGTFEHRFAEPGSYDYFCEIHPTMRATVVVEAG